MHKAFLMGNEVIAMGALAAGVNLVCGYPGTPSSEVVETVAKQKNKMERPPYVEWSVNEKVAMEVAAGAAYSGARVMVTMKQVGLNVASDPLMSLAYIGVKGGMVVMCADDPGPISSQTEQDTRHFASFSKLPVFDPSTAQEAYEMVQEAFDFSEKYHTPVLFRPTTRVCHGYASLMIKDTDEYARNEAEGFVKDSSRWVIFPRLSYQNHQMIEKRNAELSGVFSSYHRNILNAPVQCRKGIVSGGISYTYAQEELNAFKNEGKTICPGLLKITTPFPFPEELAASFLKQCDEVLVLEELDPVIERELVYVCGKYGLNTTIRGKLTGDVFTAGENSRDLTREYISKFMMDDPEWTRDEKIAAGKDVSAAVSSAENVAENVAEDVAENAAEDVAEGVAEDNAEITPPALPVRPPVLCAGCPHRASFYAVKQAMKGKKAIFCGDIGCYTLGNAMPLDMVDTCLCMGAGLGISQGMEHIDPDTTNFAFVGDSTFFASAIPGVVNALYNDTNMTLVVLDNATTAMTGHQPHPGTGRTMMGNIVDKIIIEKVLEGLGVQTIRVVDPLKLEEAIQTVKEVVTHPGVKAIIFRSPCIALIKPRPALHITQDCINCKKCIRELGCPGIVLEQGKVCIDPSLCNGCGLCTFICPKQAIQGGDHE